MAIFKKVPNRGLIAMRKEKSDYRDVSWPKQWTGRVFI